MNRKVYCPCDSDFKNHYQHQAGKGFSDISVFQGVPYQRGYGIGSVFRSFGIPLLKFLGKQLVKTGVNIGTDYLSGRNFVPSVKDNAKKGIRTAASEGLDKLRNIIDQSGSGIRKRKRRKVLKKDIFS